MSGYNGVASHQGNEICQCQHYTLPGGLHIFRAAQSWGYLQNVEGFWRQACRALAAPNVAGRMAASPATAAAWAATSRPRCSWSAHICSVCRTLVSASHSPNRSSLTHHTGRSPASQTCCCDNPAARMCMAAWPLVVRSYVDVVTVPAP